MDICPVIQLRLSQLQSGQQRKLPKLIYGVDILGMTDTRKLSLVIPAYNEADNIKMLVAGLVEEFRKARRPLELIVVNNGSTDETSRILTEVRRAYAEVKVVDVFSNRGYGNGVLEGLKVASGYYVGWMHADLQISPGDVVKIFGDLETSGADLAKGVRKDRFESKFRNFQSAVYNAIFALFFGGMHPDVNGTPKLFKLELLSELRLVSRDWFLDPEIIIKLIHYGKKIVGRDIVWRGRKKGNSKVSILTPLGFIWKMIIFKLKGL